MTTVQKIEKLNEACDNSLNITCHCDGWQICSYADGSPLEVEEHYPCFKAKTLREVISLAYGFVFRDE